MAVSVLPTGIVLWIWLGFGVWAGNAEEIEGYLQTGSIHSQVNICKHEVRAPLISGFMTDPKKADEQFNKDDTTLISCSPSCFRIRLRISPLLYPKAVGFRTMRIGPNTFVKLGAHIDLSEAHTMRFVAARTSVPVPKIQRAWRDEIEDMTYILMDVVNGVPLAKAWHSMLLEMKNWVVDQLKDYIAQLRALQPPSEGAVTSVIGGPLRDGSRIGLSQFGPFQTHEEFHSFLRVEKTLDLFVRLERGQDVIRSHRQEYKTKFTHGDFAPRNIMVDPKDGKITAIVDWDSAGWFPEYWEYTKASFTPYAPDDWVSRIGEITGTYEDQLKGERALWVFTGSMLT